MDFIVQDLLKPIGRRLGTFASGMLIGIGASQELAMQVEMLIPVLLAFAADLALSKRARK